MKADEFRPPFPAPRKRTPKKARYATVGYSEDRTRHYPVERTDHKAHAVQVTSPDGRTWVSLSWDEKMKCFNVRGSSSMQIELNISNDFYIKVRWP